MADRTQKAREGYLTGDAPEGPTGDAGEQGGGQDARPRDLAGALPPQQDPRNQELIGTGPVVLSDIGQNAGSAHDLTAPSAIPAPPSHDDDRDRDPDAGLDNTRANF